MINILPKKSDDIAFTRIVTETLGTFLSQYHPKKVYVIQVDRRFDFKWKGFKGKYVGAVGAWNDERLRIPPFNPKKIVQELYFEKSGSKYVEGDAPKLHIPLRSEFSHERRITTIGNSAFFVWYSGETMIHPYGSVMAYTVNRVGQSSWFISFVKKETWQIAETLGISEQEARSLFEKTPEAVPL